MLLRIGLSALLLTCTCGLSVRAQPASSATPTDCVGLGIRDALRANADRTPDVLAREAVGGCVPPDAVLLAGRAAIDSWTARSVQDAKKRLAGMRAAVLAEKAEEDRRWAAYFACTKGAARRLALASGDAADLVARASLAACSGQREAVVSALGPPRPFAEMVMSQVEVKFFDTLLLEIMRARGAEQPAPVSPVPMPSREPI